MSTGKIVVARAHLLPALSAASKAAAKKNTIPVLNNVLLDSDGERLRVVGTNLDQEVTASAPLVSGDEAAGTLPAQLLHDAVKGLPESAEVTIDLGKNAATVSSGKTRFRMPILPAGDFPLINAGGMDCHFTVEAERLQDMLSVVGHAVSHEETRTYLNGIYLHAVDQALVAAATDGHRLARWRTPLPEGAARMPGIILPRQSLNLVTALIGDKGPVAISLSDSKLRFEAASGSALLTKLVEGTYPDYARTVPHSNPNRYRIDRAALAAAVARVTTVETMRGRAVKFEFGTGGTVALAATGEDRLANDELSCEPQAEQDVVIGLSGRYIAEMLAAAGADRVEIVLADNMTPALIEPVGNPDQLFVIMPMRV